MKYRIAQIKITGMDATIHFSMKIIIAGIDILISVMTTCCGANGGGDGEGDVYWCGR
jgi:hypothetical protein